MADEREARALAAGEFIEVEGNKYTLRPIVSQHLLDLEREALASYRRSYLASFSDSVGLLPEDDRRPLLLEKMDEVARWTLRDLPQIRTYDLKHLPMTKKVQKWIKEEFDEVPKTAAGQRGVLTNALEGKRLDAAKIKELTGGDPKSAWIRFDQWWVTGQAEGMISFIVSSLVHEHPELTRERVAAWSIPKLIEASKLVESVSTVDVGNG